MKKMVPAGIALIAMLSMATAAAASDIKVSLGAKLWTNTWKEDVKPDSAREFDNGRELMAGPSLNVRYSKNWFADITYLTTLDDYESQDWNATGGKMKFERTDLDALAGFLVQDPFNALKIGFFAAYKAIDAPAAYTNEAAGLNNVDAGTWKLTGPGVGVLLEKTLDEATTLSGNVAYMFLEREFAFFSGPVSRFDTDGWAAEVVVAHVFTKSISANIGIKFQRFKGEQDGEEITSSFSGLTGGIAYTF